MARRRPTTVLLPACRVHFGKRLGGRQLIREQAALLIHLTDARRELMQLNDASPTDLKENPNHEQIDRDTQELNDRIVQQQRAVARPVPYHFVISPASQG